MISFGDALAITRQNRPLLAETGSGDLDSLTGGVRAGQLWVITGAPGAGKTTLTCQVAAHAADDTAVCFLAGIEGIGVAVRVGASKTGVSAREVQAGSPDQALGLLDSGATGRSQDLRFGDRESTTLEEALCLPESTLIIVDDLDLWSQNPMAAAELIKTWSRQAGSAAVVTVPEAPASPRASDWQAWVRVADVIVSVLPDPDECSGLAWLDVLHYRSGPKAKIQVVYEPWRSRLRDLSEAQKSANL